jgi:RimJ/RimL family protein N-acetyltransferase
MEEESTPDSVVLVDVYGEGKEQHCADLYAMLTQRPRYVNISHEKLPSWSEHVKFLDGKPYNSWYMICWNQFVVGQVYVTSRREIGIQILDGYQRRGLGTKVLDMIKNLEGDPLYANINPRNKRSRAFFAKNGFKLKQVTYMYRQGAKSDATEAE